MKVHVYHLWEHLQQEQGHHLQQQAQQQAPQLALKWQLKSQLATCMMVLVMVDGQLQRQAVVQSSKHEAFVIHSHSSIKMIINNMSPKDNLIGKIVSQLSLETGKIIRQQFKSRNYTHRVGHRVGHK